MFGRNLHNNQYNQNGNFNNGYNNNRHHGVFLITLLAAFVIGGVIFLYHKGDLGFVKDRLLATPREQQARVNQGMTAVTQANKNIANEELVKRGDKSAANDIVHNPILLKDQVGYLPDIINMGNKVYSVYFFANNSQYDKPWLNDIKEYRKQDNLKIYTYNGNSASNTNQNDLNSFVYHYFNHNYTVSKDSKYYGKYDGVPHPFMLLIVNDKPAKLIVKSSDEKKFLQYQYNLQVKFSKDDNNFNLPNQPIGIPYPDYKKYFNETKKAIQNGYSKVDNAVNDAQHQHANQEKNNDLNNSNVNDIPNTDVNNNTNNNNNNNSSKVQQNNNVNY